MSELKAKVVLSAVDKNMGQTINRLTSVTGRFNARTQKTAAHLDKLKTMQRTAKDFSVLSQKADRTAEKLALTKQKTEALGKELAAASKPSKKLQQQFEAQRKKQKALNAEHQKQHASLNQMRGSLGSAAKSSRHLEARQAKLKRQIQGTKEAIIQQKTALQSWNRAKEKLSSAVGSAKRTAVWGAGLAGVGGTLFYNTFVKTAAEFERFETMLTALEGSSTKAKKSMDWVSNFAAKTPLDMESVLQSFVKLRTFGMDPMDGTMQSLVDVNARLGGGSEKLEGIVLAVGQAWTKTKLQGEEALQLIERGVPVWDLLSKATGKSAVQLQEMSSKGELGRDAIKALLKEMGKFADGAADKQMKTWNGMMSNLSDQWTRIKVMVMKAGVFDFMKDKLGGFLSDLNKMADNGKLQEWANTTGETITRNLTIAWDITKALASGFSTLLGWADKLATVFGGWKTIIYAVIGMKMIAWAYGLTTALIAMAAAAKKAARYTRQIGVGGDIGGDYGGYGDDGRRGKRRGRASRKLRGKRGLGGLKFGLPLALATSAFNMHDTWTSKASLPEKLTQTAGVAGGAAGGWGGAAAGAALGTMVFPGVGTAIGGAIGGALGYWGGSEISTAVAESVADAVSQPAKAEPMSGRLAIAIDDTGLRVKMSDLTNMDMDVSGSTMVMP